MQIKSLYLRNFRNYEEAEIVFGSGLNIFIGDNAQGKTNLLEALYLVATGRSFRTSHLTELTRFGSTFFFIEALIVKEGLEQKIALSFDGKAKHLQIDGNTFTSFNPLLGSLPFILYTPQDLDLIVGPPAIRRRFLNMHLAQMDPLYVHHLARFLGAMKERNCLLRITEESIDCWEESMAVSGQYLMQARKEMLEQLQIETLANETLQLRYQPSGKEQYLQQLQKNRARDRHMGMTMQGPHRDEVHFLINGKEACDFASEGQKKTAIAALRFAEWNHLAQRAGNKVLMGIDDLGMHLDDKRQHLLQKHLGNLGQVFITTPAPSAWGQGDIFHVEQGKVRASERC